MIQHYSEYWPAAA